MKLDYSKIIEELGSKRVKRNESLVPHTTFRIGGAADLFYEAKTTDELVRVVRLARKLGVPYFVLGGGSNILVADDGFRGLIIRVQSAKCKAQSDNSKFKVTASAGVSLGKLLKFAVRENLAGLEFLVGIPGTVGGAVRGNAGAWQQGIGDRVLRVRVLGEESKVEWVKRQDCKFGYRRSRFQETNEIILEVELELERGGLKEIKNQIEEYRSRRKEQPKQPSAGCIFVNPKPEAAGGLIDKCGLKGRKVGEAQISPLHANFIVNLGKAKASDVIELIKLAKKEVKKKFGVVLKEEIQLIGFGRIEA